jgi:hypothetical protein
MMEGNVLKDYQHDTILFLKLGFFSSQVILLWSMDEGLMSPQPFECNRITQILTIFIYWSIVVIAGSNERPSSTATKVGPSMELFHRTHRKSVSREQNLQSSNSM